MHKNPLPSQQNLLIILIITLLTFLCFFNSLFSGFIYDDKILIINNTNIQFLSNIPNLFKQTYWGTNNSGGNYRPLTNVSFALNFAISGLNTYGYHLVNIFIHIVNSLFIYWLSIYYSKNKILSFLCALFFALHPVHSEPVSTIYGRPELLATMFLLIAWWFYAKSESTSSKYLYLLSLTSYFCSLLCKESGIVLLGILYLVQICKETSWPSRLKFSPKLLGYILATVPYLVLRVLVTKTVGIPKGGQYFSDQSFLTRVYTMSLGYVKYFQILIWPSDLCGDCYSGVISIHEKLTLGVFLSLLVIIAIIVIGIWQIKKNPLVAFSILFFFVATSVVSNIIIPTGVFIAERVIYLASLSVCLLAATFLYWVYQLGWKKLAISLATILLLLTGTRTYLRNFDFQDEPAFFNSMLKVSPKNIKATYALGLYYQDNKDLANAEIYFKKAIENAPNYPDTYAMLGNCYLGENQDDKALEMLNKAISLSPKLDSARTGLARFYVKKQDYKKAVENLLIAINSSPPNAKLEQELAVVFYNLNDFEQATLRLNKAIALEPFFAEPYVNLAKIKRKQAKEEEATGLLKKALELDPKNADANNLWGAKLLAQGDLCQAKVYLTKAVSADDSLAEVHNNLGVLYAQMNIYDKAREHFQLAVKLNPSAKNYVQNLELINEKGNTAAPAINCPD